MSKLDPDTATTISLIGTAERLFTAKGDWNAAITKLQEIATEKGRLRTDLLAEAAGHFLGSATWTADECYRLLYEAGGEHEPELIKAAAEQTRFNRLNSGYGSEGMGGPNLDRRR